MSELDAEWARRVEEAEERARADGRGDVAGYLALRSSNDAARAAGVARLVEVFQMAAGEANRAGASLSVTVEDAHRFRVGQSTMVGRRLTISAGVRSLTIEAGWPRAPADGFVRGGGLARARVSHFGDSGAGEELLLVRAGEADGAGNVEGAGGEETEAPRWLTHADGSNARPAGADFDEARARAHVAKLLG